LHLARRSSFAESQRINHDACAALTALLTDISGHLPGGKNYKPRGEHDSESV
jgi:hypothetical protein